MFCLSSFKSFKAICYGCKAEYEVRTEDFSLVLGNPCRNGGVTVSSQFGYHCLCSRDYHGRFCDGMKLNVQCLSSLKTFRKKTR